MPPEERRKTIGVKRAASVERVENDNAELKRAHVQSVREHIQELRQQQMAAAIASADAAQAVSTEPPPPAAAAAAPAAPAPPPAVKTGTRSGKGAATRSASRSPPAGRSR